MPLCEWSIAARHAMTSQTTSLTLSGNIFADDHNGLSLSVKARGSDIIVGKTWPPKFSIHNSGSYTA